MRNQLKAAGILSSSVRFPAAATKSTSTLALPAVPSVAGLYNEAHPGSVCPSLAAAQSMSCQMTQPLRPGPTMSRLCLSLVSLRK